MFAFAMLDQATGYLFLARDPFGIKPLHYIRRKDGVVFASELKALVAALGTELRMDPQALVASMLYYWVPEQRCSMQGVRKAPARDLGRVPSRRHLSRCERVLGRRRGSRCGAGVRADDLARGHRRSVNAHLVADVPVSSFLSGGLDSSIVTVLAQAGKSPDRRVHDHVPSRGPAARSHAGRRHVRPEGRATSRHRAARD